MMLSLTRNVLRSTQPIARTLATRGSVASIHSLPALPYGYDVSDIFKGHGLLVAYADKWFCSR